MRTGIVFFRSNVDCDSSQRKFSHCSRGGVHHESKGFNVMFRFISFVVFIIVLFFAFLQIPRLLLQSIYGSNRIKMQRQQYVEEDEVDEEEIDIDSIDDEQILIQLLDDAEDFDDRKRIRDRLRKIQFELKAQHEEQRLRRENDREAAIRNRLKEADEKKQRTLQMYSDMAKAGPPGVKKSLDGSRPESPAPGIADKPRDLVEETIRQRVKAADDRKKRLLAAYDHAAKSQPPGQARIVEFDSFKRADVSKLETPKVPKGSCCFGMSGGIAKFEKVASAATPKSPSADEPHLDRMERAIRARVREAEERKRRTLAAYDIVARSGGAGPKVVILEEFKNLDVTDKPKPRYDPCFRGGLKTQSC